MKKLIHKTIPLIICGLFLFTACGQSDGTINADYLIMFDKDGYATFRGEISGGSNTPTSDGTLNSYIEVETPADVQGVKAKVTIPFFLSYETEISSKRSPYTNIRSYLADNPDRQPINGLPTIEAVEITFTKDGKKDEKFFYATSVRQIPKEEKALRLDGVFSADTSSKNDLTGTVSLVVPSGKDLTLMISVPLDIQGGWAFLTLPIKKTNNTQVTDENGAAFDPAQLLGATIQVQFIHVGDILEAIQVTKLPQ